MPWQAQQKMKDIFIVFRHSCENGR